jgi:hypothetical protein
VAHPPPGEGQAAILIQHTKAQHTGGQDTVTVMDTTMGIRPKATEYVPNRLKPRLRQQLQNHQGSRYHNIS